MSHEITETDEFVFFWNGWPSQWFTSPFERDGVRYGCCEQYMMAEKARVFGDVESLDKILSTSSPREQKALGRHVRGFDAGRWESVCRGIVYTANLAKVSQHPTLAELLLATGDKTMVEASPTDRIWGIGLAAHDHRALNRATWRGTNWLGIALEQVRGTLRGDASAHGDLQQQLDRRSQLLVSNP